MVWSILRPDRSYIALLEQNLLRLECGRRRLFLGCMLSLSSAALMAFFIAVAAYVYDQSMRQYSWRWVPFWLAIGAFGVALSMAAMIH